MLNTRKMQIIEIKHWIVQIGLSLILLVQLETKGGVIFYRVLASKEDPISWSISEKFQNHANPYSLQLYSIISLHGKEYFCLRGKEGTEEFFFFLLFR